MRRALFLFTVLGAACSGNAPVPGAADLAAPVASDLAQQPAVDMAGPQADLSGESAIPLGIGPIPLASGQERTVCSRFKLPNTGAIDIVKIDAALAPGSHHLILYKSMATQEKKDLYDCPALDISGGDVPIYIAETQSNNALPLPTGVAYHIDPGQMVRLEAHYINASPNAIMGMGEVHLTLGGPGTYQKADIMFCGTVTDLDPQFMGMGVPPGAVTLKPGFYKVPDGIKVFGLTTHEHQRGTLMTVDKSSSSAPGTNLTMGTPFDNPPFQIYGDKNLLTFAPGEGFRWQCHYQNDSQNTYYFGQSAVDNEMCFFWAYYYPSVNHFISVECIR